MQLHILVQASLKAQIVPTPDLTPWGHWHSTTTSETKVDMSTIHEDYHDFADIFHKSKASKLADHWPYNLKITLDEGTSFPTVRYTPCPGGTCCSA